MTAQSHNAFHHLLQRASRPLYGLWLGMAGANSAEICGGCGFDWLLIDAEHGPNTLTTVLEQLRALNASPASVLVRLPEGRASLVKQYLDIGAHNLLIPMVDNADQAAALARAMRYPPEGVRGLGTSMARAARWNQDGDYLKDANDRVSLIVQIETRSGLENIDQICATDGVDAVFIGPSDLSASLGFPGQVDKPEVVGAVEGAIASCRQAGKPVGVLALNETLAASYAQHGAAFVGVGVDTILLSSSARSLASRYIARLAVDASSKY